MKKLVLISCFFLVSTLCYATPQAGDLLAYKGDTIRIYPFILETFLKKNPEKEKPFKQYLRSTFKSSSGCWRGYRAVFEIKNDSLFLTKAFSVVYNKREEVDLSILFNDKSRVFVDWFSGKVTSPKNRLVYFHGDWGGMHEFETEFIFENGILIDIKKYQNQLKPSRDSLSIDPKDYTRSLIINK